MYFIKIFGKNLFSQIIFGETASFEYFKCFENLFSQRIFRKIIWGKKNFSFKEKTFSPFKKFKKIFLFFWGFLAYDGKIFKTIGKNRGKNTIYQGIFPFTKFKSIIG